MKDKRCFFMLRPSELYSLGFPELVAYSFLVYRTRFNKRTSQKQLAAELGFDQRKTIRPSVVALKKDGLVEANGAGLLAKQPPEGWFREKAKPLSGKPWSDQLQYYPVYLLDREADGRLTARQNCLLWLIASLYETRTWIRRSGWATLLRLPNRTVRECVSELKRRGLLDECLVPRIDKHQSLWQDTKDKGNEARLVKTKKENRPSVLRPLFEKIQWSDSLLQFFNHTDQMLVKLEAYEGQMRKVGYRDEEVLDYWRNVIQW